MTSADDQQALPEEPAVRIEYCVSCGFLGRAVSLAESVLHDYSDRLPGGVTVVAGEEGALEVFLGRQQLFSMLDKARFPEPDEVETALGKQLGP